MKKIIITTALTGLCTSAFAQNYTYEYEYQPYEFQQQQIQEEPLQTETYQNPYAQNQNQYTNRVTGTPERNWDMSVGLLAGSKPQYTGAGKNEFKLIPIFGGEYRINSWQKVFFSAEPGAGSYGSAGYGYSLSENLELGLGLGYREGRDSSDAAILQGLKDVDDTLTYMAFANYEYYDFNFRAKISKGMKSGNDGISTKLSAAHRYKASPKLVIISALSTTFGDSDYMKQNFSTTENASVGRSKFKADSGFKDVSFALAANYNIDGPHNIIAGAKVAKLIGDAKKSPVSKDDTSFSTFAGYRYKF